ncbi:Uncharacterised protein [Streptococcus pneumoniae]|nr:Uncharacterised protein [Streptococcus pneumoniae]
MMTNTKIIVAKVKNVNTEIKVNIVIKMNLTIQNNTLNAITMVEIIEENKSYKKKTKKHVNLKNG